MFSSYSEHGSQVLSWGSLVSRGGRLISDNAHLVWAGMGLGSPKEASGLVEERNSCVVGTPKCKEKLSIHSK